MIPLSKDSFHKSVCNSEFPLITHLSFFAFIIIYVAVSLYINISLMITDYNFYLYSINVFMAKAAKGLVSFRSHSSWWHSSSWFRSRAYYVINPKNHLCSFACTVYQLHLHFCWFKNSESFHISNSILE